MDIFTDTIIKQGIVGLSDKEIQLIKKAYRKIVQTYYEDTNRQTYINSVVNFDRLIRQTISLKKDADSLSLLSILQILKVKGKSSPLILKETQITIQHLRSPKDNSMSFETVLNCFKCKDLFSVACTIAYFFYPKFIKISKQIDWKAIIDEIGKNCSINTPVCLDLAGLICKDNQGHSKLIVKSGLAKYIVSFYLQQNISDKFLLYKALKFMKLICVADRSIIRDRQKGLTLVIYQYDEYIPVIEQMLKRCYDQQYCQQVQQKRKYDDVSINQPYLWSYNQVYSMNITKKSIDELQKILTKSSQKISSENECKIYAILANITKYQKINLSIITKLPINQKSLFNYMKLVYASVQNDPQALSKVNFKDLEKLVDKSQNQKVLQMFKYLSSTQAKISNVGHLNSKMLEMFNIDKNADILMQGAKKIPKNNDQASMIRQILKQKEGKNQFQADTLKSVKQTAIQTLMKAITQRHKIDLNLIFKEVSLTDITLIAKLLQVLQVALMMDNSIIDSFDAQRIFQIIQWIQDNYRGQLIDWGSIGQIIIIFKGQQQWKNHLQQIPKKCYWLLSISPSQQEYGNVLQMLKSVQKVIDSQNYKLPLIIGFLGRIFQRNNKLQILQKFPNLFQTIKNNIKNQINWKTNLYMSSYFLNSWYLEGCSFNKKFQTIIGPVHEHVLTHFRSTQHQYQYLQSCLPYKINPQKLTDNINYLISQYGQLATYLYQNSTPKAIVSYDKISNISNIPHKNSSDILQLLKFLSQNSEIIQGDQIQKLCRKICTIKQKYWELYPNFVSIIAKILQILGSTNNPQIKNGITNILVMLIQHLQDNQQISPEQADEIMQQLLTLLKKLAQKGVNVDLDMLKRAALKVQNEDIQTDILSVLSTYKIVPQQNKQAKKRGLQFKQSQTKQQQKKEANKKQIRQQSKLPEENPKIQGSNLNLKPTVNKSINIPLDPYKNISNSPDRNYMTNMSISNQQYNPQTQENVVQDTKKQYLWKDQGKINMDDQFNKLAKEDTKMSQKQMTVVQALKKLKKINDKIVPTSQFTKLAEIFSKNQLNTTQRDILGHLLVFFYNLQQRKQVLNFLLNKQKTNLSQEACYEIINRHVQAFVLSQRWKLVGKQWLEIAMKRIEQGFLAQGCQVAEYNLIKVPDIQYFAKEKHPLTVIKVIYNIKSQQQAIYYLLLVGTSARLAEIKLKYVQDQIHMAVLSFVEKWQNNSKIIANAFYALSSLVYLQPDICLSIVEKKSPMTKLLNGLKTFYESRAVVQSGACFVANLAYSNDQVKQILRKYGIIDILIEVFEKNLANPETSTYKQLLRAFGNLSLSLKCTEQIINKNFCLLEVKMIQKFDMFVNLDQNKLKILKIAIDLIANMCSHKYNLGLMHEQKITLTIITLLQTTQINPPIIMGCIDTIDGLCQNQQIQHYAVTQKRLPYILIDVLKIQQDQKIIVKATRLLTNLTLTANNIPYILQANLLSVLANIVMPSFFMKYNLKTQQNYLSSNPSSSSPPNKKMQLYVNKILLRIHNVKPKLQVILKSGYLDCLVRTIETSDNLQDIYIDILLSYAQFLPNFLNKRAFMCLIKVLTQKVKVKQIVQKCLNIFKILLLHSYDKDEEDVVIEGSPQMYEKMIEQYKEDTLFLIGLHCSMSEQLRKLLIASEKHSSIIETVMNLAQSDTYQELANSVLFTIFNKLQGKVAVASDKQEQQAFQILNKGFNCTLYRIDGSKKNAKIEMDKDYNIVAYKYPGGQIKNKYSINIRFLRDWQFNYQKNSRQWKLSVFTKNVGMFSSEASCQNSGTLVGGLKWGQVAYVNIQFQKREQKEKFFSALSTILFAFR